LGVLRRAMSSGRLPGAYLFVGPSGVGKRFAATQFVKAVNCKNAPGEGCDSCQSCRMIDQGTFPDLFVPESKGGRILKGSSATEKSGQTLSELMPRLQYRPMMGSHKFMLLDPADGLIDEAASMLLKTMEEPPPLTTFILISSRERSVLSTLVSRCQKVRFSPLGEAEVASLLVQNGVAREEALLIGKASQGSVGAAMEASQGAYRTRRTLALDHLLGLSGKDLPERVESASAYLAACGKEFKGDDGRAGEERRAMHLLIQVGSATCRDMLSILAGERQSLVFIERETVLRQLANKIGYDGAIRLSALMAEALNAMSHNENPKYLINWLGSEWNRVIAAWEAEKGKHAYV